MQLNSSLVLAGAAMAGAMALAQGNPGAPSTAPGSATGGGAVIGTQPVYTPSMQHLQASADRLRQAIEALAGRPPGPDREAAIAKAHEALLETQQAMLSLPPELRSSGTVSAGDYDAAVTRLMQTADQLRQAVQAMAQQPAGERRNQAIRQANRALLDTQVAMAHAYQPGTSGTASMGVPSTITLSPAPGASPSTRAGASAGTLPQRSGTSPPAAPSASLVLLPPAQGGSPQLAEGCWVRFYDGKDFKGDSLTLAGPVQLANMSLPSNVWRDWHSAVVGPRATVITFDNEDFRDRSSLLEPGQQVPDLHAGPLSWFEEVKSAKVSCG
ncbi:beta/gamma crystallin domain-containing protein [Ramlibacter sp.]|uniref:beta/gamma crystallin domain-containing protein n=1 Tax=Ramlibacter sp. TaxID=1917967 RepID=UPI002FC63680